MLVILSEAEGMLGEESKCEFYILYFVVKVYPPISNWNKTSLVYCNLIIQFELASNSNWSTVHLGMIPHDELICFIAPNADNLHVLLNSFLHIRIILTRLHNWEKSLVLQDLVVDKSDLPEITEIWPICNHEIIFIIKIDESALTWLWKIKMPQEMGRTGEMLVILSKAESILVRGV